MTPREALDRIAALCDRADAAQFASAPIGTLATFHLRAVLAEVSPEPGGALDRACPRCGAVPGSACWDGRVGYAVPDHPERLVSPEPGGDPYCGRPSGGERCGVCGSRQSCYPEPGGVLDRDQARDVLMAFWEHARGPLSLNPDDYLDRLARCVRPAAIDRDALDGVLGLFRGYFSDADRADLRARLLALVRPVAGVTLTPEDVPVVLEALRYWVMVRDSQGVTGPAIDRQRALAARLEAAS